MTLKAVFVGINRHLDPARLAQQQEAHTGQQYRFARDHGCLSPTSVVWRCTSSVQPIPWSGRTQHGNRRTTIAGVGSNPHRMEPNGKSGRFSPYKAPRLEYSQAEAQ